MSESVASTEDTGRHKAWVFTHHDYTAADEEFWKTFKCEYLIAGRETCPSTGRPHLQGFFILKSASTKKAVLKKIPPTVWIQASRSTPAAIAYIKNPDPSKGKTGDFFFTGEPPVGKGKRTDIDSLKESVRAGATITELFDTHFALMLKYPKGIMEYKNRLVRPRDTPPSVYWLYGPTGTGKSRYVFERFGYEHVYSKPYKWWTKAYCQQQCCLIDDFTPDQLHFRELLRLLDRYPYEIDVKCSDFVQFNSPYIFITSDVHPSQMYTPNEFSQLSRRITEIIEYLPDGATSRERSSRRDNPAEKFDENLS